MGKGKGNGEGGRISMASSREYETESGTRVLTVLAAGIFATVDSFISIVGKCNQITLMFSINVVYFNAESDDNYDNCDNCDNDDSDDDSTHRQNFVCLISLSLSLSFVFSLYPLC